MNPTALPAPQVGLQFTLAAEDLRLLQLNPGLGTRRDNSLLTIGGNSGVFDGNGRELSQIFVGRALMVGRMFTPDTTRPQLVEYGFLNFDLNVGQFTLAFTEPMNSVVTTPANLFQHQSDAGDSSDIFTVQSLSCVAPECRNNETITFTLPREELNRIKLMPRVCSSHSTCWLTLLPSFIRDMAGNPVIEIPNGNRSTSRLPVVFVEDTEGPLLESYTLNLTSRQLVLSFDEPIQASSFNVSGLTLQSERGVSSGDANRTYRLTGGTLSPDADGAEVTILLSDEDVNGLQSRPAVAISMRTTYLTMEAETARDLSPRQLRAQGISSTNAQLVSVYEGDRAPPEIQEFNLDLDSNSLTLTFSEPVLVASLALDRLVVASSRGSPGVVIRNITGGRLEQTSLGAASVIRFSLLEEDLTFLEVSGDIATSSSDTFLALEPGLARDTNQLASSALPLSAAVPVREFVPDTSAPEVAGFSIDMDQGEAVVTFDDVILVDSVDVGSITFQSSVYRLPMEWHTLDASSSFVVPGTGDGLEVVVEIGESDLNRLKQIRNLTTSVDNSFLTLTATLADDAHGVDVIAITDGNAIPAGRYVRDTRRPSLEAWTLDLDAGASGQVILTFSETVDIRTLDPTRVTLSAGASLPESYTLSGHAGLTPPDADYRFAIQLSEADANVLKERVFLATGQSNSYISISRNAIEDTSGNDVLAIPATSALGASVYVSDQTDPILRGFSLDLDMGVLRLSFDETVHAATFDVSALTLLSRAGATLDASYTLRDSPHSNTNSSVVVVTLSPLDLNAIKAVDDLATFAGDTFLAATPLAVMDTNGNRLSPVAFESALSVGMYVRDSTSPMLRTFVANMSSEQLIFTFSETVSTVVDPTQLTLQSSISSSLAGTQSITLTGGAVMRRPGDGTVLVLQLEEADANELKRVRAIATSTDNTYVWLTSGAIRDPAGNFIIPISETDAFQASEVVRDLVPPVLEEFTLNLDSRELRLIFDETVDSTTFAATELTLQDAASSPRQSVKLGSFSRTNSPDGTTLLVALSDVDFNAITATFPLATLDTNTFLSIGEGVVSDTAGVLSSAIGPDSALMITDHRADRTRPMLRDFDLDLDLGVISLTFSESVNVTSFDATQITLQDAPRGPTQVHTLRGGVVAQRLSTVVDVTLIQSDLNDLKALTGLGSTRSDSYVSITSATVTDMNGNTVLPVPMNSARLVRAYFPDQTGPVIQGFDLDYNTGLLTLYFDETVDLSTFLVEGITLQRGVGALEVGHTLTADSNSTDIGLQTFVPVQLSAHDLNELKRLRVCVMAETCHLSATSDVIMDVPGNRNMPIPHTSAMRVGGHIPDMTRPLLSSYAEFDLDEGTFTLEFSETVDIATLNSTHITLDDDYANATFTFEVEDLSTIGGDSFEVTFLMGGMDLNRLKLNTGFCTHQGNCWLTFSEGFIGDVSGNSIVGVAPDELETSRRPLTFAPDVTPPILLSYTIDLDAGRMGLTFDEVVRLGTFLPMNLTFQDAGEGAAFQVSPREFGQSSRSDDGLSLDWNMTVPDLNLLKSYKYVFSSLEDAYLAHSNFIEDVSGVGIEPRSGDDALRPSEFVPDTTSPMLQYFTAFNFDNATLTLQFDEPVNLSSIDLSDGFAITRNETFDLGIYDRIYINDWYSVLFENGSVFNLTHTFDVGEYVLRNCPFSLFPTPPPPTEAMTTTEPPLPSLSGSGSGSGSGGGSGSGSGLGVFVNGTANDTLEEMLMETMQLGGEESFYPLLLRGCQIYRNLTVMEPFYFLTGGKLSHVDERKQQVQLALNRVDLRALKLSFLVASNSSDTWIAFNETDLNDMAGNEVVPSNLFDATRVREGGFVEDVTPPTFEFAVLDMDASILSLHFNDVMDVQSVQPVGITLSEYPGANNSYVLQGPYPSPAPLTVDQSDHYFIDIPLSFDDMNSLKNNPDLATSEFNTYVSFSRLVATDIYGQRLSAPVEDAQVRTLIPDETGPILLGFTLDYDARLLNLMFDEVVDPNSFDYSGIVIQNSRNSSLEEEGMVSESHRFVEGGTPLDNTTGVSTLSLVLDQDLNALLINPGLGSTINDSFITIDVGVVLDTSGNPNQRIEDGMALQATEVLDDMSPPFLVYYDLNLNDNFLVLKFSEAVRLDTFNVSALTLQSTLSFIEGETDAVMLSQNSRVVRREFDSLLLVRLTMGDEEDIKNPRSALAKSLDSTYLSLEREVAENYFGLRTLNISEVEAMLVRQYFEGQ